MSPAGSGSLGLVLLAHTIRCIVTISYFCIDLAKANLRLFSLWAKSCFLAATLNFHSFTQSIAIIVASSKHALGSSRVTITVLIWAIPYLIFLECILYLAALIILLEKCETVYLHLRSFRFGTVILGDQSTPQCARLSRDLLGLSSVAADRILSVPKQSPSFRASTTPKSTTQTSPNRPQTLIRGEAIRLLALIDKVVLSRLPKQAKVMEPSNLPNLTIENHKEKPAHLFSGKVSHPVVEATNHISLLKDKLLSKIVEYWGRFPTPTLTIRAFHLQMRPLLRSAREFVPKRTSSYRLRKQQPNCAWQDLMELDDCQPASPQEDRCPAIRLSPVSPSWPSQIPHTCEGRLIHPCRPKLKGMRERQLKVPSEAALHSESRTFTVLSNLTSSLSRTSLSSFTGSDRKASHQTVASRKTSSSSTLTTTIPTRTPTPMTPEVNPLIITTAQPSAYWSGRFMSLQDRFQGESLQEQTLSIFVTAHASKASILAQQRAAYQGRGNLPLSTTTALDRYGTAAIQEAKRLSDEDNRSLRIFLHLQALCGTPEAKRSLQAWQEAYARRMGRSVLLPEGANPDRGFVARLFSGSGGGRRSFGSSQLEGETGKGKQGNVMQASIM
ncbi:uncharacterized protein BDZ83DRAFT_723920 [Colletotrichum acutatum]|uniref:Uncharacterized protein n=1 Tax=Glomerella acutata TaxID=27357 RepID=A0AAD8UBZ7_GLOAC|nr:uncharacterized protein BDZ83DRAFT_723920 [Colletotrichum acutatum]KAK1711192.1 hypothetical protein BDZ83DRAFT_723920 [Colletotrichum acutatum]